MDNLSFLKSGTDIRGTAFSFTNGEYELTNERVSAITAACARTFAVKTGKSVMSFSVGCDSRVSSDRIKSCVADTLLTLGHTVTDCGMCSTPAMFMTTVKLGCDGAFMITASHLPAEMNGIKLFTRGGGFDGADIAEILAFASEHPFEAKCGLTCEKHAFLSEYASELREMIIKATGSEKPFEYLKIVVDAGSGVGGFYANRVLAPLGADTSGSRYLEPNGLFPGHVPNPENKAAMDSIREAVIESEADFGIIFDTDVDRAACVFSDGSEINRNRLVALASYIALKDCPGGTIVTDSVTSDGLARFIEHDLGGVHRRFKRGYKNVIDESKRLNGEGISSPLAIETSGHAAFACNYFLDDGAYLITRILIELARRRMAGGRLSDITASLSEPAEEKEIRYKIALADFKSYGLSVIEDFKRYTAETDGAVPAPENYEGLRVSLAPELGDGWLLLRMSLHEPLLVMNCESAVAGGTEKILTWFNKFIGSYGQLS